MDYEIGTCSKCGGTLTYIHCLDIILCDTCSDDDTEEEEERHFLSSLGLQ